MLRKTDGDTIATFNTIAPLYGLFFSRQKKIYRTAFDSMKDKLDLSSCDSVLDIGCGTGALSAVLRNMGLAVTAVDPAGKMLAIARRKNENSGIQFLQANVLDQLPFEDRSFDLSIASYVAHGLQPHERNVLYSEMKRVTRQFVLLYDYNQIRSLPTTVIEWLEKGDYFRFIQQVIPEMELHFRDVRVMQTGKRSALYAGRP